MEKSGVIGALAVGYACALTEPLVALGKIPNGLREKGRHIIRRDGTEMKGILIGLLSLVDFLTIQSLFAGALTTLLLRLQTMCQLRPSNCGIRPLYATGET